MARVLAISSHVTHGNVGLTVTVPALQRLGHEVWPMPTVLLASRPGLGLMAHHAVPAVELDAMLAALEGDGSWSTLDAVLTGYFPSPESVVVVADVVARIKQAKPAIPVLVDPILGDAGSLYVTEPTAAGVRDRLLPLATIATPNLFELQWLADTTACARAGIEAAARRLGVETVIVTSAVAAARSISTLLVTAGRAVEFQSPLRAGIPNGTGDLFAGFLLGFLLRGTDADTAVSGALGMLDVVLAASENLPVLQLSALKKGEE